MSHSTVLVIGEDPEKMLEPYDENIEVEPYRRYDSSEKPADHWLHSTLVAEHDLDPAAGWPEFVRAWNERYKDEPYEYDAEKDRIYSMSTYNPNSKWDWYLLGGRWTGFFRLKPGATGVVGQPGVFTKPAKDFYVDQARKRDIDWEAMREDCAREAVEEHSKVTEALHGLEPIVPWPVVRDERFPGDIGAARNWYHSQPGIKALWDAKLYTGDPVDYWCLYRPDSLEAFVDRQRSSVGMTFAVLDHEGWHERGRMGWFGLVSDERDDWPETWRRLVDRAPDDALFSVYDVHI